MCRIAGSLTSEVFENVQIAKDKDYFWKASTGHQNFLGLLILLTYFQYFWF